MPHNLKRPTPSEVALVLPWSMNFATDLEMFNIYIYIYMYINIKEA